MRTIISFCNTQGYHYIKDKKISPLAILDTVKNELFWIKLPLGKSFIGLTGIEEDSNYIYVIYQSLKPGIYIIDKKNQKVRKQALPEVDDPHSILIHNKYLYIVSSGNDSVFRYKIKSNTLVSPAIVWKAKNSQGNSDTHHVNSIHRYNNDIYVSAFGPKKGKLKKTAKNGYLENIDTKVKSNFKIFHPHSLTSLNNKRYYCESATKSIKAEDKTLLQLVQGYTRGLVVKQKEIIFGTSSARKISKSTGIVSDPQNITKTIPFCKVFIYNKTKLENYDLSDFFKEIYDIKETNYTYPSKPFPIQKTISDYLINPKYIKQKDIIKILQQAQDYISENETYFELNKVEEKNIQLLKELVAVKNHNKELQKNISDIKDTKYWKIYSKLRKILLNK